MSRNRWLKVSIAQSLGVVGLAVGGFATVQAAPPSILNMFQERSAAATEEKLALQAEHGPWHILAMTLSGDDAESKSIALAKELRTLLHTNVYIHRKEFDHSQPLAQASARLTYSDKQSIYTKRVRHANAVRENSFAVLVGDFSSADDPRIAEMLKRVKTAHPACLSTKEGEKPTAEELKTKDANWLIAAKRRLMWQKDEESAKKGPMGAAFVTRNPLLPDDYFQNAVDDFVVSLNDKMEYSLLECPGRYTVRVATFTGRTVTELASSNKNFDDKAVTDSLEQAAIKAGKLAKALRAKGVEAYQFHDRTASYVTIGSFESLGDVAPTGQFVYNPEMVSIMNQWCGYEMLSVKDPQTGMMKTTPSCKTLKEKEMVDIPFDVEGKFISVPRPAASKLYGGSLLGKSRVGQ